LRGDELIKTIPDDQRLADGATFYSDQDVLWVPKTCATWADASS
jgi:hypothetical protein